MPPIYIECPTCAWEAKIDETQVGKKLKCPKCAASFIAEVGGTYDLAENPVETEFEVTDDSETETPNTTAKKKPKKEPKKGNYPEELLDMWPDE
jgi:hypothetical protein